MRDKKKRYIFFARISVPWNGVMAVAKLLTGIFTGSLFLCINAFYNVGIGLAKVTALKIHNETATAGEMTKENREKQLSGYRRTGLIIAMSGAIYVVYCVRMFLYSDTAVYNDIAAISIATFTVVELFLSFSGASKMRRQHELMLEAVKRTNMAAALVSVVLMQTAILSFAYEGDVSFYNGLSGLIFGSLAAVVGLLMPLRVHYIRNGKYAAAVVRRATRMLENEPATVLGCVDPVELPLRIRVRADGDITEDTLTRVERKLRVRTVMQ